MPTPNLMSMLIDHCADEATSLAQELFATGRLDGERLEKHWNSAGSLHNIENIGFSYAFANALSDSAVDALAAGRDVSDVGHLMGLGLSTMDYSVLAYGVQSLKIKIAARGDEPNLQALCDDNMHISPIYTVKSDVRRALAQAINEHLIDAAQARSTLVDAMTAAPPVMREVQKTYVTNVLRRPLLPTKQDLLRSIGVEKATMDEMIGMYGPVPSSAEFRTTVERLTADAKGIDFRHDALQQGHHNQLKTLGEHVGRAIASNEQGISVVTPVINDHGINTVMHLINPVINALVDGAAGQGLRWDNGLKQKFAYALWEGMQYALWEGMAASGVQWRIDSNTVEAVSDRLSNSDVITYRRQRFNESQILDEPQVKRAGPSVR